MVISVLLFQLLLLSQFIDAAVQNSALCYMSYRPALELIEFVEELALDAKQYGVDLFIMVDDDKMNISTINVSSNLQLLQISREKCLQHNYHKAINTGGMTYPTY